MKRILIILLVLGYLAGISGSTISFHYCGKKFKYVTLNKTEEKPSCCKGKMKGHGCCDDKQVTADVDDHQYVTPDAMVPDNAGAFAPVVPVEYLFSTLYQPLIKVFEVSHSPPLLCAGKLYIVHCTWLI